MRSCKFERALQVVLGVARSRRRRLPGDLRQGAQRDRQAEYLALVAGEPARLCGHAQCIIGSPCRQVGASERGQSVRVAGAKPDAVGLPYRIFQQHVTARWLARP